MASWRRLSDRSPRSSSPSSPLLPISPIALPQWLRNGTGGAVIPPGKYKILTAALACMMLGWLVTTLLSPEVHEIPRQPFDNTFAASTGVLDDPTGFGADVPTNRTQHASALQMTPTIKGALGDLHKAMSDKISSWSNAYTSPHNSIPSNVSSLSDSKSNGTDPKQGEQIHDGQTEDERLGARTRIGKCTILFNANSLWERAIKSHETHDKVHGYRLHVLRQHLLDDVWSKPAYILSLILRELAKPESERLEWLLWVDADTILLNPYIPVETFLPPPGPEFEHIHLLFSNDWNGLNNGVFPIRVNQWAVELLSAIVAFRYYRPEEHLTFRDQSAMDILMKEPKFAKNIIQLPQRWFNAYMGEHNETLAPYQIRRGDLLVHFAGVIDRNDRMALWLDRAEQHMDDWEVPYKSTSYPQEVKDFWAEQRSALQGHKNEVGKARHAASELLHKADSLLNNFADRVSAEQLASANRARAGLGDFLAKEEHAEDIDDLNGLKAQLEAVLVPLATAEKDSHKLMLTAAHEAIFAGEKELVEAGFYRGVINPEAAAVDTAVKYLKDLVMSSEEAWDRHKILESVDVLTTARGRLKNKVAIMEGEEVAKKEAAEMARKKMQEAEKSKTSQAAEALAAVEGLHPPSKQQATNDVVSSPAPEATAV